MSDIYMTLNTDGSAGIYDLSRKEFDSLPGQNPNMFIVKSGPIWSKVLILRGSEPNGRTLFISVYTKEEAAKKVTA